MKTAYQIVSEIPSDSPLARVDPAALEAFAKRMLDEMDREDIALSSQLVITASQRDRLERESEIWLSDCCSSEMTFIEPDVGNKCHACGKMCNANNLSSQQVFEIVKTLRAELEKSQAELKDTKSLLMMKNDTANTFMNQVKKLYAERTLEFAVERDACDNIRAALEEEKGITIKLRAQLKAQPVKSQLCYLIVDHQGGSKVRLAPPDEHVMAMWSRSEVLIFRILDGSVYEPDGSGLWFQVIGFSESVREGKTETKNQRKQNMNEKEQETAAALLEKLRSALANEVVQYATAYQALTQGAINRQNSEKKN